MLEQSLSQLESTQLIRQLSEEERTYLFKHALTQEAAYESLLLKTRRELHARVARAYERLFGDQLDEYAALLARHYDEAGDAAKTLEYSRRAGDAAARMNANLAASDHYRRAIEMAQDPALRPSDAGAFKETLVELYLRQGRVLELSGQYEQAAANYVEMEREGERRGDAEFRLAAMVERAKLLCTPKPQWDWTRGVELAQQALSLARELGDQKAESRLLWILLLANYYGAIDLDAGARYGEESIALARQLGLREQLAHTLNDLGGLYNERGESQHSLALLKEAEGLWRELNIAPMLTDTLGNTVFDYYFMGDLEKARQAAEEGIRLGEAIGNEWGQANCGFMLGQVYLDQGEWGRAIDSMNTTIRLGELSGHPGVPIVTRSILAEALGELGEVQKGLEVARAAVERGSYLPPFKPWALATLARLLIRENELDAAETRLQEAESGLLLRGSSLSPVFVMLARGELALARGDYARAVDSTERLLEHLRQSETRVFAWDALLVRARGLLGVGQMDAAYETLKQAEAAADAVGSRRSTWAILLTHGELARERGHVQEAAALRARARNMLQEIVASLYQPELRRAFAARPEVQAALIDES